MSEPRRSRDRRSDALDSVLDVLVKVRKRMPNVDQLMDDMAAGYGIAHPTEVIEDPPGSGNRVEITYQSSTEATALNPQRDKPGKARRRREQILKDLAKLTNELDDLEREFLGGGDAPKPPDPKGCAVVGRFKSKDGRPLWAPVDRTTDGTAFLANAEAEFNKGASITVCSWAYEFGRRVGRWPYRAEIESHLDGRNVSAIPVELALVTPLRLKRSWRRHKVA